MEKELFYAYLKEEKPLDDVSLHQLQQVAKDFPYFQTAHLLLLKNMKDVQHPDFMSQLQNVAITCSDREKLFYYLNDERYSRFFPKIDANDTTQSDRTELLLDSFLASIENDDNKETENSKTAHQWESNSIVSTDYMAYLDKTEPDRKSVV